ncbi:MAG: hypothetical protein QOG60_425 [Frankiaceae bacterium]|jgi:hypothetical protein|nr:hypothetical protein [Frankiaceae bacterium]
MLLVVRARRRWTALLAAAGLTLVVALGTACGPPPTPNGVMTAKRIAWQQLVARGWAHQAQCLVDLWQAESSWNVFAYNPASGAYGIPQALPAKRMAAAGRDWIGNPATQIRWGLNYIGQRYGGPCNAWRVWKTRHWYDKPATAATPSAAATTPPTATAVGRLPDGQG